MYDRRQMRRNQAIYDEMPVRMVVSDAEGKIHFIRTEKDIPGKIPVHPSTLADLPQHLEAQLRQSIARVMASGKRERCEYEYYGMRRKAFFSRLPKEIFGKETVLWVSIDISELAASRAKTEETARHFRTTLESIGDGVIVTDTAEIITMCNPVAAQFTGIVPEEAV